ncbi:anthranilate synthase component I family protein [Glycomyces sp. NEAU-7082]|uniref:Anthranilate synthase component I family protein n=1 Tax=Glycomyces albidus TaxID=2656774 RepID=A0A6L5GBZ9_9ACTN|nr:chorismate-binding protein [Glycomyces albidus]MQM27063.1 anthranilate synthase component I family protein [Glycomyces albidus]
MSILGAVRPAPPGLDAGCRERLVEVDRLEWRVGEGGDPAALAEAFCARFGGPHSGVEGSVCGVAVLVSAAAGAVMVGGATGAPSPVPAVPDLVLVAYAHGPRRAGAVPGGFAVGPWRPSWSGADHAKAVVAVQEAIGRGQVYVANVVGHRSAPWSGDAAGIAAAVAGIEGAAWGGVLSGDGWLVASGSPEAFVTVEGSRAAAFPIKGTAAATEAGRAALLGSVKERAEHVMVVDLERNDLARVAVPGSVAVERLFDLARWDRLWQAESTVVCELAAGTGLAALLRAMCPPGSVTGTPKLAMLDLVSGLEPVGRGPSMGAFGFVQGTRVRLGVTIRTVALDESRAHLWAGGGITWRSDPDAEVAEADGKARAVTGRLGLRRGGTSRSRWSALWRVRAGRRAIRRGRGAGAGSGSRVRPRTRAPWAGRGGAAGARRCRRCRRRR